MGVTQTLHILQKLDTNSHTLIVSLINSTLIRLNASRIQQLEVNDITNHTFPFTVRS